MATFPLAHASSPAPTKQTTASTTIVSNTFTGHPVRSCAVVSVTSDADVTTGGVPTIAQTGGEPMTWIRVAIPLGYSSTGDVGVVVVFAGVYDDLVAGTPPASRGDFTVTVTLPGVTASKPKLLIPRVYDDTQVDVLDPIGAAVGGSFSSGTLVTGTLTPETSEGGIRGIQLDWNATGIPATLLPNNDNSEVVDSFHNASLSTNLAISGKRRTRAGVAETLGVRLNSSATDGNWLIYELRGPQPAAGPAFDSAVFASAAFATSGGGGTTPVSATRSTTWRVRAAVSTSRATTWRSLAGASAPRSTTWDTRTSVTATRSTTWRVTAPVSASRSTTWDARAVVSAQRSSTWNVGSMSSVSAVRSTSWNVRALATSTRSSTWRVAASVSTLRTTTWNVRREVTAARASTWDARSTVTATRSTTWDTTAQTSRALAASWDTRTQVAAQRSSTWNVDSTMVQVAASRSTTWRTKAQATAARAATWDTRATAVNTRPTSWDVRTELSAARSTSWRTRALVIAQRVAVWRSLELVTVPRSTSWAVQSDLLAPDLVVGSPRPSRYDVGQPRASSFALGPTHPPTLTVGPVRPGRYSVGGTS